MKNYFKHSILIMLALVVTISLVYAQPVKIGKGEQKIPFESNPTIHAATSNLGATLVDPAKMYDGDLLSYGSFTMGTGLVAFNTLEFNTFTAPADPKPYDPGWVDIKIKLLSSATSDDKIRIEYSTTPPPTTPVWSTLLPDMAGAATADNPGLIQPFVQVNEPTDGSWSWTDIVNLRVRFYFTKVGSWDVKTMNVYEVFASVYPLPLPPGTEGSPAASIQPSEAQAMDYFFVDIYGMGFKWWDEANGVWRGVSGMQFTISYDTSVLTALEYFQYYPFKVAGPGAIDDAAGTVDFTYFTYGGDPVGFIGNAPLARIYFKTDSAGSSDLHFSFIELARPILGAVYPPTHDGKFWGRGLLSAVDSPDTLVPVEIDLANPKGTNWHELYPGYSHTYTVTDWFDNNDGTLSVSDSIKVQDDVGRTRYFHIDLVTKRMHFTLTDLELPAVAEPITTWPSGDPGGSRWLAITPIDIQFQAFAIDVGSWTDTDTSGGLSKTDTFTVTFDDPGLGGPYSCVLDNTSTDITMSETLPEIPEFPLGIGVLMAIAPLIPIVYIWRLRKRSR